MSKLKVTTREIGSVCVFDLEGCPTQETLQEIAWKIQRNIRRHRLQRVIINLQHIQNLDPLGLRKLLAACIRPQRSLIYGASNSILHSLEDTYLPQNVRVCNTETEVAEDFGPFLLEREKTKEYELKDPDKESIGRTFERRRSKRMHVAIPLNLTLKGIAEDKPFRAIAVNISEGGLFSEFLDLDVADRLETFEPLEGREVEIHILPNGNFPEEYQLKGKITRTSLNKKQLGVGIEFLES